MGSQSHVLPKIETQYGILQKGHQCDTLWLESMNELHTE